MIYPIVIYGDDVLRKPCEALAPDRAAETKTLIENMFLTLDEAGGVGLAAPQIGKSLRLFIVDCTPWADEDPACADYKRAFLNAEIYERSADTKTYNEGCLSFPG
ncbi:MAG: peptide deformylase, partial [Alistipes sp.]|nr:peptide deformylase [Alistipes sp.]